MKKETRFKYNGYLTQLAKLNGVSVSDIASKYTAERGVNFRSLTDSIDTSTPMGRFFFHVMGALAEMERELIVERTRAGLEAARAKGRVGGRRPKLTPEQWAQAGRLIAAGETRQRVALIFDVGVSTLYRKYPATLCD